MLYQLSHFRPISSAVRSGGAESQIRTGDTVIFSHVLYQLSYLGTLPEAFRQRRVTFRRPGALRILA